jgi:hypothetical protein
MVWQLVEEEKNSTPFVDPRWAKYELRAVPPRPAMHIARLASLFPITEAGDRTAKQGDAKVSPLVELCFERVIKSFLDKVFRLSKAGRTPCDPADSDPGAWSTEEAKAMLQRM